MCTYATDAVQPAWEIIDQVVLGHTYVCFSELQIVIHALREGTPSQGFYQGGASLTQTISTILACMCNPTSQHLPSQLPDEVLALAGAGVPAGLP
jgi:hypothetical protein